MVVVVRHAGHYQRTPGPERLAQRVDQDLGPAGDRSHVTEGGVYEEHATGLDAQSAQLLD
jgi:hypothetical protein